MTTSRLARRQFVDFRGHDGTKLPHLPGLDGLRGLAVAGVVLFHADLGFMVGGYLGVSTFFTLSGFLIASLLLKEASATGTVQMRSFWGRRFRRLLPASLVTLLLVATLFAWFVATPRQIDGLRGGVLSSLAQVANWHFVLSDASYGDLFAAPSPVLHFWSLAIEEQFYLVFPLAMFGLWRVTAGRRVVIGVVLGGLALLSAIEPLIFTMSNDRIYFGTDTRAAELLLGALLAVLFTNAGLRKQLASPGPVRATALGLGAAALAVQLYLWWTLEQSAGWLYRGGFALYALLTCAVLVAAAVPAGPLRRAFSTAPLVYLGHRSYGIYLLHWPIFLAIRQSWNGLAIWQQAGIGIVASLGAAELSFRFIERPIRERRWPSVTWFPRYATLSIVTVALIAFTIPTDTADPEGQLDFEQAEQELDRLIQEQAARTTTEPPAPPTSEPSAPTTTAAPAQAPIPSVATYGDSTALLFGLGFLKYAFESGTIVGQPGDSALGCGVSRFESRRVDKEFGYTEECIAWPQRWAASVRDNDPDVAQLITGAWEVTDARLPGTDSYVAIGSSVEADAFIKSELMLAVDTLGSNGALVLLVLWPRNSTFVTDGATPGVRDKSDPARMRRLHELMREIADERPDNVRILDLEGYLGERVEDPVLRPDGVHIPADQADLLYHEWMGAETLRIWSQFWREQQAATDAEEAAPSG